MPVFPCTGVQTVSSQVHKKYVFLSVQKNVLHHLSCSIFRFVI